MELLTEPVDLGASDVETRTMRIGGPVKVLLHGRLAQAIGREIILDLPTVTASALVHELATRYPESAATITRSRLVANDCFVDDRHTLGDVVELLPPVSGG